MPHLQHIQTVVRKYWSVCASMQRAAGGYEISVSLIPSFLLRIASQKAQAATKSTPLGITVSACHFLSVRHVLFAGKHSTPAGNAHHLTSISLERDKVASVDPSIANFILQSSLFRPSAGRSWTYWLRCFAVQARSTSYLTMLGTR